MLTRNLAYASIVVGSLFTLAGIARPQEANAPARHVPLQKTIGTVKPTGPVPSLAVINAAGATLENGKLTLKGVSANSIVFADRPVRAAGHVTTEQFIMQWDEGKNNFARNPPNATVSVLGGDGSQVSDAVVTLKSPKLEGGTLTFEVSVLEGGLGGSSGPAAVFIDDFGSSDFGGGGYGGGIGGADYTGLQTGGFGAGPDTSSENYHHRTSYWHAPVYHGAWYRSSLPGVTSGNDGARPRQYYSNYYDSPCVDTPFAVCY